MTKAVLSATAESVGQQESLLSAATAIAIAVVSGVLVAFASYLINRFRGPDAKLDLAFSQLDQARKLYERDRVETEKVLALALERRAAKNAVAAYHPSTWLLFYPFYGTVLLLVAWFINQFAEGEFNLLLIVLLGYGFPILLLGLFFVYVRTYRPSRKLLKRLSPSVEGGDLIHAVEGERRSDEDESPVCGCTR